MPSLGCQDGFAPHFDLDSTEHSVQKEPSMSQELLDYLVRNTGGPAEVSDLRARPVIRATAAVPRPGPDAHFQRVKNLHLAGKQLHGGSKGDHLENSKFVFVMAPWEMCAHVCRCVDHFFQRQCEIARVDALGVSCRVSPLSTPLDANLVFGFRFGLGVHPLVVESIVRSVMEHIQATTGAVIQNADFPAKHVMHLSDNTMPLFPTDFSGVHVSSDEILLRSSL